MATLDGADLASGDRECDCSGRPACHRLGSSIVVTTRIGLSNGADLPWRFCVPDAPDLSRR